MLAYGCKHLLACSLSVVRLPNLHFDEFYQMRFYICYNMDVTG